jgi:hypothetical protein
MIRKVCLTLLAAILLCLAVWIYYLRYPTQRSILLTKLDQVVRVTNEPILDCTHLAARRPLVILALGQSNAANHGQLVSKGNAPVALIADNKCVSGTDPLPGSTGHGASIWARLPSHLSGSHPHRPLVLSVMGIDATSIAEWTDDESPLRQQLVERIKSMKALGLLPTLILWQQGEADARKGTNSQAYGAGLDKLAAILAQAGSDAPIVMAYSTYFCRSAPSNEIRQAIYAKATESRRFKVGPDTDTLKDADLRFNGCHFSDKGLHQAAQLWAAAVSKHEIDLR